MGLRVKRVDINGMTAPLGIDTLHPVFHYTTESDKNGSRITAHRFVVTAGDKEVWDSGKLPYDGSNYRTYGGEELMPKTAYQLSLTVWDEDNTKVSERASFETGLLGTDIEASWIEPEQEPAFEEKELSFMEMIIPSPDFRGGEGRLRECKQLRRELNLAKQVKKARIYATAHGVYNLYLNGEKVSEHRLAPEISAYDKILYYQTYDVTKMLRDGSNTLGVLLADGWWIGRLGMAGDSCNYGDKLGFLMRMEICYEDGTTEALTSDEQFESSSCYIRYSDMSIGEKWDLTYGEQPFVPCKKADYETTQLIGQPIEAVTVTKELPAERIFYTPKNELVIDFGQVMAGVCRIELDAAAGEVLTLEHGEILDKEGNYCNNILGRNKDQKDVLVCKDGVQVFEPQFTYHGFRYVRVTGVKKEQIRKATALVIGTPLEKTGSFSCSDERLNALQHAIEWSTVSNMFSIPTDCPQREKLGWTGDIQVYTKTGCFNYELYNFLQAWLANVRAEQTTEGEIPVVVPNLPKQDRTQRVMSGSNSSAAWGDACVLVPWYLYETYGDIAVLSDNFEMMTNWLSYIKESAAKEPEGYENFTEEQKARNPYLWTKQYHFGDWLIPSLRALPDGVERGTKETAAVVGSCFYAITVSYYIKVCRALGKTETAAEYQTLLGKIKQAVREEFVAEDGTVGGSELQGLYVMVLKADVTEGALKQKVLNKLVGLIEANGDRLDTGFASVSYLLDELYDNDRADVAYKLLFQEKAPSWLYMIKNGATTMWENWLAVKEDGTVTDSSYNHYAFGCVGDFIYRHIGGIQKKEAGYRRILFAPDFNCGLTESDCSVETPYGTTALHWKKNAEGAYEIAGMVPVGVEAEIQIGSMRHKLESGKFSLKL